MSLSTPTGEAAERVGQALLFFSNLPESLVGAVAMRDEGRSRKCAIGIWCIAAVLLALAVVVGRVALEGVDGETMAVAT